MPTPKAFCPALRRKLNVSNEVLEDLVVYLENGIPVVHAARLVDLSPSKLQVWLGKGEQGVQPFDKLYEAIERAKSKAVEIQIMNIARAASNPKHWQAAVYMLEHLDKDFARKDGMDEGGLDVEITIGGRSERRSVEHD